MLETAVRRFSTIIVTLLSAFMLFALFSFVQFKEKQGSLPSIFGFLFVSVVTGGMHPSLEPGDAVVVRKVNPEKLIPGDIIAYLTTEKKISVSRIMEAAPFINQPVFILRGDAENRNGIVSVEYRSILGKSMLKIPYGGYFARFARSTEGVLLIVIFPFLILVTRQVALVRIYKEKKAEKKRQRIKSRLPLHGMGQNN